MREASKPKALAAAIRTLSRKTRLGRPMPKGYSWEYCLDGTVLWTNSSSLAELVRKANLGVTIEMTY